jgi:hypothetical protein
LHFKTLPALGIGIPTTTHAVMDSSCNQIGHHMQRVLLVFLTATALTACKTPMNYTNIPMPPIARTNQLDTNEVMAMIELCVDLDNQDDRMDPRHSNIYNMQAERYADWGKLLDSRDLFAARKPLSVPDAQNPALNGFPPFDSAWTLWTNKANKTGGPNVYALAFRGTVFANDPSVAEDALATTAAGQYGLQLQSHRYLPVTFATFPRAEVHEGFAYGTFGIMFDKDFGVLTNVMDKIEPNSTLIITGHSQGAALATLAHAFFFYAAKEGRFDMAAKNLALRSYVFAQPKPGNYQFMQDFARITGGGANSFVFNNTLDPVPMMPPTHYFFAESFDGDSAKVNYVKIFQSINNTANYFRRFFSGLVQNKLARKIKQIQKKDEDGYAFARELKAGSVKTTAGGVSQGYAWAGDVIPLVGLYNGGEYYHNPARDQNDAWVQHHATSYRRLLETIFGYPATMEQPQGH